MSNSLGLDQSILSDRFEGQLNADRAKWYNSLVDKAVRKLLALCPGLLQRYNEDLVDKELVADKVADAVLRVVRNPGGYTNESQGNYSYGMNQRVASGDIWYPDNELAELGCNSGMPRTTRVGLTPGWVRVP